VEKKKKMKEKTIVPEINVDSIHSINPLLQILSLVDDIQVPGKMYGSEAEPCQLFAGVVTGVVVHVVVDDAPLIPTT
jgi:hypothetical protein